MPRLRWSLRLAPVAALTIFLAACGEQSTSGPDVTSEATPDPLSYSTSCSTQDINALIDQVFSRPLLAKAFKIKVNLYIKLSKNGPSPAARARLFELVDELLKFSNTVDDPARLRKIEALIGLIYCILNEPAPPLDLVNGGAAVVTPTTGATVTAACTVECEAGANDAATQVEPGDLPASVPAAVVSIVLIEGSSGPLDTPLEQRGPFYEFTVTPNVRFAQPVLTGICLNKFLPPDEAKNDRLRLAHNLNPSSPVTEGNIRFGNIEIIAPESDLSSLNLACDPVELGFLDRVANWLLPEELHAGGRGTSGRGGLVSEYSPFGGVVAEPLEFGLENWLYQQPSTGNPAIPATAQGNASVPFFAAGGATTPSTGQVWQGDWTFGSAPFGDTQSDGVPYAGAQQCNGQNGTVDYALRTASLWARASASATTDQGLFTYLYARRVFYSASTSAPIRLALDNDIRVWINGTEVLDYVVNGNPVTIASGDFLPKEGCAKSNQVLVSVPRTGINVISVQARDRGVASYFDAAQVPVGPVLD